RQLPVRAAARAPRGRPARARARLPAAGSGARRRRRDGRRRRRRWLRRPGMTQLATGKREATKAHNRRAILDPGREILTEMGYGAASIRDVVRRSGLASGTFYNYFPDKASVFAAVLEEHTTELRRRLRESRSRADDVEATVREGFSTYFSFIVEDR